MAKKIPPLSDFITSRNRPRNKSPRPTVNTDSDDLSQLVHIFPDIDREYARLCLQQYTHGRVAAVTEKLLDKNFTNYPRHVRQPASSLF
jgi:CUE domain